MDNKRTLDNDFEQQDNAKRIKQFNDEHSKALLEECNKNNASLEIIKKLIENNADVNIRYSDIAPRVLMNWIPTPRDTDDPSDNFFQRLIDHHYKLWSALIEFWKKDS